MAGNRLPKQEIEHPPLAPCPRALKTSRDVRRELVALYKQCKRYQIGSQHAGRLCYILNAIVALDQGVGFDDRLRQLEERIAGIKPNGSARPEHRL
jgi:hypothetical protein